MWVPQWHHETMSATSYAGTTCVTPPRPRISRRLAAVPEAATLAVDAKAKALKAAGRPVIGFGAGEPDFATPAYIVDAAVAAAREPKNHRYSPAAGQPELKKAITEKTLRDSGVSISPAQVLITNGGKQAVFQAMASIVDDGDEVLLPAPYWTTYPEAVALAGGKAISVLADDSQDYLVTVAQLEAARTEKTKALILCSPSNPTGAVYTVAQMAEIGQWALQHGIWVVADEIYEHMVYGVESASILHVVPELADHCIVVNGVAKTYAMTGWRVGWMFGPVDVIAAASNFQSHVTSNVCNVAQAAALAAISGDLRAAHDMREAFDRRRRTIVGLLREIDSIVCPEPHGAFYVFPSVRGIIGRSIGGVQIDSSARLAEVILDQVEVAVVPGEAFGAPGYLRLSYALSDDDLAEGVQRIKQLLESA